MMNPSYNLEVIEYGDEFITVEMNHACIVLSFKEMKKKFVFYTLEESLNKFKEMIEERKGA